MRLFFLLILVQCAGQCLAQHIKYREGDPTVLNTITRMNVQYRYDSMTVTRNRTPVDEFVEHNVQRLNNKKPGKGMEWKRDWINDRKEKLEPHFSAGFDQASGIQLGDYPRATYTLILHTSHMETGHNIRISRKSAFIDFEATVVETDHPEHIIYSMRVEKCKGKGMDGYDFAALLRLMEAYELAGQVVGEAIKKQ